MRLLLGVAHSLLEGRFPRWQSGARYVETQAVWRSLCTLGRFQSVNLPFALRVARMKSAMRMVPVNTCDNRSRLAGEPWANLCLVGFSSPGASREETKH